MATPRRNSHFTGAYTGGAKFTPGATARITKIDYTLVRSQGLTTTLTHAVAGDLRRRCDIIGAKTLCGVRVTKAGTLVDYKTPGGPGCKDCARVVFSS